MARSGWPVAFALAVLLGGNSVRADAPYELAFDPAADGAATSGLASGLLIATLGTSAPSACRACEVPGLDLRLAELVGSTEHPETYAGISDVALLAMLATSAFGGLLEHGESRFWAEDLTITLETLFANGLLNVTVKRLSARPRPAIKLRSPNVEIAPDDAYVSFFSGHASTSATLAATFATLAYLRGYSYRHVALGAGIALALGVGVLRMAAQRHWFTDVLTGWIVGAALGVFMPLLLHEREPEDTPAATAQAQRLPMVWFAF